MKTLLILSIFMTLNLSAQNLAQILESFDSSSKSMQITQKLNSDIAKNEFSTTFNAPALSASISRADSIPVNGEDGTEYGLGFSQDITNPFSRSLSDKSVEEYTKALKQEAKHQLHILELNIASAYHSTCISKDMRDKSLLLYQEQNDRFSQVQRAYELGEISRKDLLFNKLDLSKLQKNVSAYKRNYLDAFSSLQEQIDSLKIVKVDCDDLISPHKEITLNSIEEHGELKVLEYKKNATRALYQVSNSAVSSLAYEIGYEKELDMKRYTFGVSIPLDSLSSQKEKLKAEQLALSSSLEHQKDVKHSQVQNYTNISVLKIELLYDELKLLENDILPLGKELAILSKSALLEGEGDIMEYLDASRSYSINLLEMLEVKKNYYDELFQLYKIADIQLGEKTCKN